MAKAKTERREPKPLPNGKKRTSQTHLEGMEPIKDVTVRNRAKKYSEALTSRMEWQKKENEARVELIDKMKERDVPVVQVEISGEFFKLELVHEESDKIKRTKLDSEEYVE